MSVNHALEAGAAPASPRPSAGTGADPLLAAHGVIKQYDGFVLGPVDLALEPGRIYGLLGANGAGKTTLIDCLAGQSRLTAGEVRWNGRAQRWGDWRLREEIALVRETPALYEGLTALDHLRLAAGVFARWDQAAADRWLAHCRLEPRKRVKHYSKGMRVKLALAIGLAHRAQLLLLDEPTAGLDPDARADLLDFVSELSIESGAAVVIASHVFDDVESLASDVCILSAGRLVYAAALADVAQLTTWTFPLQGPTPATLPGPAVLGAWKSRQGRHVLSRSSSTGALGGDGHASSRPATLRDVYFAHASAGLQEQ
jgi:ABC-2 type transport system ATP-binding protein